MNVIYTKPSFNTPIKHLQSDNTTSTSNKILTDFVDDYFSWGNRCHVHKCTNTKILNGKTVKILNPGIYHRSIGRTIFKIATYITLIIPIIMLFAKIIYRSKIKNNYALELQSTPSNPTNGGSKQPTLGPDVDDGKPVLTRCGRGKETHDSKTIYITCDRRALKWRPEDALRDINTILEANPHNLPNKLDIIFSEEVGVDNGGLARQFVSDLFNALVKKSTDMNFLEFDANQQRLPTLDANQMENPLNINESYQAMGRLFVFLLSCRVPRPVDPNYPGEAPEPAQEYPIGELFSPVLFKYLIHPLDMDLIITEDNEDFLRNYDDLLSQEDKGENKNGYKNGWISKNIGKVLNVINWKELSQDDKNKVQEAVEALNELWYDDDLDDEITTDNFQNIKDAVGKNAKEPILKRLYAIKQIQLGIENCLPNTLKIEGSNARRIENINDFNIQFPEYNNGAFFDIRYNLKVTLQGELTKENLIMKLKAENDYFGTRDNTVRNWINEWINKQETTIEMLRKFVKAITGSPALAGNITIKRGAINGEIKSDTCHKVLEVNEYLNKNTFMIALQDLVDNEQHHFNES